ncbi:ABC transporter permease [Mucilaginibacter terrae]|uniref:ABC transport system permease protein n=1 Tax=Mucilaginibacter terrae TaxID=1955052 RepID=A0ABU3GXZ4_9SPHI|nr:ABC transporter permease [Mucilaginibacter terrae]MDT3404642.1 putative ABC transport system permease protein [Mucilaginibacter terrae]
MLKNYIKIAWRNLLKNRVYSFINIFGLALGMSVSMLIGLWLWDEVSYNTYHQNYNTVAQVMITQNFDGHVYTHPATALPLAPELRTKFPADFKRMAQATWPLELMLRVGEKTVASSGLFAEPQMSEMLSLKMLSGRLDGLKDPKSAFIAQSLAHSLFGNGNPVGQTITINNQTPVNVAGVYEDVPPNSTFGETKILATWQAYVDTQPWVRNSMKEWSNHSFQLFAQVNDGANWDAINTKIKNIAKPHFVEGNDEVQLFPMSKWHLYNDFKEGKIAGGKIRFVWLFGIIGVFVLLLACINFMNLSTARSEKRSREVGVRKAMGSVRRQLIGQFLSESLVMAGLACFLAAVLVVLFLPIFNQISSKQIAFPWFNPVFWLLTIVFTVITGLIAGSYPAFYLSGFNTVKVLKGTFKAGRFAALPRKILVVIQFTVSVTLIIGTIIVFRQIKHAQNRPVGYQREGLVNIPMRSPDLDGHYNAIRQDFLRTGVVADMAESSSRVTAISSNQIGFDWQGRNPNTTPTFGTISVTHDYGKTIGWQIMQGRDYSRSYSADTSGIIINEAAAKIVGFKNPVGQTIVFNSKPLTITGVVKDMIMESPYIPTQPTVYVLRYDWAGEILVRIKPGVPVHDAITKLEAVMKRHDPKGAFEYKFVDDLYASKFENEQRIGNLATLFAILAIAISSLGLFGLASFVAEQRTKEIGVRKVLGASVYNLWSLLSKDFVVLVLIACFIAIPLAWYFLSGWLQAYEYRTSISWWIFGLSGLGAMFITLLTVSFQAIKAAITNPVKSLRTE